MVMHSDSQPPPAQRPPAEPAKAMLLPSMESALFINEIAEAIVATLDPTQLIPVVTEKVKQLLCADDACLLTAEPGGALAVQRDGQITLVPPGEGVAGWVAQHGKPAPDHRAPVVLQAFDAQIVGPARLQQAVQQPVQPLPRHRGRCTTGHPQYVGDCTDRA